MDPPAMRAQIKDLSLELKEARKELERVRMKLELRMGLQDCLYCEIEMKPKHWPQCPESLALVEKKKKKENVVDFANKYIV